MTADSCHIPFANVYQIAIVYFLSFCCHFMIFLIKKKKKMKKNDGWIVCVGTKSVPMSDCKILCSGYKRFLFYFYSISLLCFIHWFPGAINISFLYSYFQNTNSFLVPHPHWLSFLADLLNKLLFIFQNFCKIIKIL